MKPTKTSLILVTLFLSISAQFLYAQDPNINPLTDPNIRIVRDLAYTKVANKDLLLDLYLPAKITKPVPLIMWIHGGGWYTGNKEASCLPVMLGFVDNGYAVASINYRLSGEAIFPAQIKDCKAALCFLRANASKYNFDPNRIGVWGSSAGGHLAALVGTSAGVKEFDPNCPDLPVQAVCDYCGPTDFVNMVEVMKTGEIYQKRKDDLVKVTTDLLGCPAVDNPDKAKKANPITYITKDDPPFLIVHGDKDPVVPLTQSLLLEKALKDAGVSVTLKVVRADRHGGPPLRTKEMADLVLNFFDQHLKK